MNIRSKENSIFINHNLLLILGGIIVQGLFTWEFHSNFSGLDFLWMIPGYIRPMQEI